MQSLRLLTSCLLLFFCTCVSAQTLVTGTVTGDGEPLIGVSIQATGTSTGTITDFDGNYSLTVPTGSDSLLFTYLGYAPQEVAIGGRSRIDVTLREDSQILDEIVVVGYGVQKKSDLTGSVAVVSGENLNDIPTQNLGQALQGKLSGVQILPTSGAPGAGSLFRIRGVGTLNSADPLFVVDGMILTNIDFLNPQDVASVSVLKDASATAIYGARGANGVVIISTKQGSSGRDGEITVSAYAGTQEVTRKLDLLNATEYATIINEIDVNEGRAPRYANPEQFGEGTNWQDEVFQTAPISSVQIGFADGGERGTFNATANYFSQEGIIDGSSFDRFTARVNTTRRVKPWLRLGSNFNLIYTKSDNINTGGIIQSAYRADPITEPIDSLGNFGNTSIRGNTGNPLATIFYNYNKGQRYQAVGNVFAEVAFLKNFTFRTNFGLDFNYNFNRNFQPVFFVSAAQQNEENSLGINNGYTRNWLWENTLSYNNTFGGVHQVDAVVGLTYQDNFGEFLSGNRQRIEGDIPSLFYLGLGDQMTATNGNGPAGDWGLESYLGRVNYTFDDRYLLTLAGRIDASSRFGANFRYAYFPSVGLGWNVSAEDFWNGGELFSRMKVRGSWGLTGNDRIGDYDYTALINSGLNTVFGPDEQLLIGQTLTELANPNLRWEEAEQFDAGVEMGFFANKLTVEVDYYRKVTRDILFRPNIPNYIGANAPRVNIAEVLNRGVDVNVGWREVRGQLSYGLSGNLSFLHNEVLKVDGEGSDFFAGGFGIGGQLATNSRAGFPAGGFYGYELDGVFQNEMELEQFAQLGTQRVGDLRFRDQNGDGVVDAANDRVLLGSAIPDLIAGLNGSVAYAGVDLNFGFTGQFGNEILNAKKAARFGAYNFERDVLGRFTGEGTSNDYPRVTLAGQNVETVSSRYVEDGSYIRLRSLQLGYTLPASISERLRMDRFRVYVNGTNVFTSTDYTGYDPEIATGGIFDNGIDRGNNYPISRVVTFGVDATF